MSVQTRSDRRRRKPLIVLVGAVLAGTLGSGALIFQGTQAAFTATGTNGTNNWAAGSVELTMDDAGTAMFNVTGMKPGDTGSKCIAVTYSGTAPADIRLYRDSITDADGLGSMIDLTVTKGTGGGFGSCAGFTADGAADFTATLAGMAGTYAASASKLSATGATTKVYKFDWTFNSAADNTYQGTSVSAVFKWEAK